MEKLQTQAVPVVLDSCGSLSFQLECRKRAALFVALMLSDFTLAIITLIAIISEYKTFSYGIEASYILELCFLGLSLAFSMYCVITNIQAAVAVPGSFSFYNGALSLRRVSPAVTSMVCNSCLSGSCR